MRVSEPSLTPGKSLNSLPQNIVPMKLTTLKPFAIAVLMLLMSLPLVSVAETVVETELPPRQIEVGELFYIRYIIVTDTKGEVEIKAKAPSGCSEVTKTVNTSVMRRGSISAGRTITYDIYYRANKVGRVEVAPATIKVGKVSATAKGGKLQIVGPALSDGPDPFLKLELSSRNARVGETITATVFLYTPSPLTKGTQLSSLRAEHCKVTKYNVDNGLLGSEIVRGQKFYVYRLSRSLITPSQSGKIKIEPGIYRLLLSGKKYSISLAPGNEFITVQKSGGKSPASGDRVNDDAITI